MSVDIQPTPLTAWQKIQEKFPFLNPENKGPQPGQIFLRTEYIEHREEVIRMDGREQIFALVVITSRDKNSVGLQTLASVKIDIENNDRTISGPPVPAGESHVSADTFGHSGAEASGGSSKSVYRWGYQRVTEPNSPIFKEFMKQYQAAREAGAAQLTQRDYEQIENRISILSPQIAQALKSLS
jgi:hypothetical protein